MGSTIIGKQCPYTPKGYHKPSGWDQKAQIKLMGPYAADWPEWNQCSLISGHKSAHYFEGWGAAQKGQYKPSTKTCKYCKHSIYFHSPAQWYQEMYRESNYSPSMMKSMCMQCRLDDGSYKGSNYNQYHAFNCQPGDETDEYRALIFKEWNERQAMPCTEGQACGHPFGSHMQTPFYVSNDFDTIEVWVCKDCKYDPVQFHKFNSTGKSDKYDTTICKFPGCEHSLLMHGGAGYHCVECQAGIRWVNATMEELIAARHSFTMQDNDYGYGDAYNYKYERETCQKLGADPSRFRLAQACADYYMLERLVADGSKLAARVQKDREAEIAKEFTIYLDLAVGGEARYANESARGYDDGYCYLCESERDHDECRFNSYTGGSKPFTPRFQEYLNQVAYKGDSRSGAWHLWWQHRQAEGLPLLKDLVDVYYDDNLWGGSFGGRSWGLVTEVLYDYLSGKLSTHLFLDRCWTMEHNGGCIFNKAYAGKDIHWLMGVLQHQATDDYDYLYKHASEPVRKLWEVRRFGINKQEKIVQVDMFGTHQLKYGWEDRDPAWFGVQLTETERERW